MSSSSEQLKYPAWIESKLFENVLTQNVPGYKRIKSFNVAPGTRPGDNYVALMLRIKIECELADGSLKLITFMLKVPHESKTLDDMLGTSNVFDIEREMFQNVVPEFVEMYRKAGLKVEFSAKLYALDTPQDNVMLEDLLVRGFRPTNRIEGLDTPHTKLVLKKLAQWHAASAVRVSRIGPYAPQITAGFISSDRREFMRKMTEDMLKYVLKSLARIDGNATYYSAVKNLKPIIVDEIFKMEHADPHEFNVLNHGDIWLSNIMFQYDESGNLKETYFVDYQLPRYGTLAQDLLYFLLSSTQLEIKLQKFDYFVKYYHENLVEHLKLLQYPNELPTLKSIHAVLIKYGIWGYFVTTTVMAGALLDPTENAKFDNIFADTEESDSFKYSLYAGYRYLEHIKLVLPWLLNRGALERSAI